MSQAEKTLFLFFYAFVITNAVVLFVFYKCTKEKLYKDLSVYWSLVFLATIFQGIFSVGNFVIPLGFSLSLIPLLFFVNLFLKSIKVDFNYKYYLKLSVVMILMSFVLDCFNFPFKAVSAPIIFICILPLIHLIKVVYRSRLSNPDDIFQKIVAYFIAPIIIASCLHYWLLREYGKLLLGFGLAFLIYFIISSFLPLFVFRQTKIDKISELNKLVEDRTKDLFNSTKQKERLIKFLVHDISNSLHTIILQTSRLQGHADPAVNEVSESITKNINSIIKLTAHVKMSKNTNDLELNFEAVDIDSCLQEINDLFFERYIHKGVKLTILNEVKDSSFIYVDRLTFVHSVMANLLSNSLKFSYPESEVNLRVYEDKNKIKFELVDTGIGISQLDLEQLVGKDDFYVSRPGTQGEIGTGFGLPLAKSFVRQFEGELDIFSNLDSKGTRIVVSLPLLEEDEMA